MATISADTEERSWGVLTCLEVETRQKHTLWEERCFWERHVINFKRGYEMLISLHNILWSVSHTPLAGKRKGGADHLPHIFFVSWLVRDGLCLIHMFFFKSTKHLWRFTNLELELQTGACKTTLQHSGKTPLKILVTITVKNLGWRDFVGFFWAISFPQSQ